MNSSLTDNNYLKVLPQSAKPDIKPLVFDLLLHHLPQRHNIADMQSLMER